MVSASHSDFSSFCSLDNELVSDLFRFTITHAIFGLHYLFKFFCRVILRQYLIFFNKMSARQKHFMLCLMQDAPLWFITPDKLTVNTLQIPVEVKSSVIIVCKHLETSLQQYIHCSIVFLRKLYRVQFTVF